MNNDCISSRIELITDDGIKINGISNINSNNAIHYLIYKITNILNGMYYYGQHKTKNPLDDYMGSGLMLENAKNKYGIENFIKTILFDFDNKSDMNQKEIELVPEISCYHHNPLCYNLAAGGKGGDLGPEIGKKISKAISGEKNGMYGKKLSKDTIEKISSKLKGHPNYTHKGWRQSDAAKKAISEKHIGKKQSVESIEKIRQARLQQKNVNTTGALGKHWYHNTETNINKMFFDNAVPDGWTAGRIFKSVTGKKYYTDGKIDVLLNKNDDIPAGFKPGRHCKIKYTEERNKKISKRLKGRSVSAEQRKKISETLKGRHWYNNGIEEACLKECPDGWLKGRLS